MTSPELSLHDLWLCEVRALKALQLCKPQGEEGADCILALFDFI